MSKNRSQRDTQGETSIDKCIDFCVIMRYMLDAERLAERGATIVKALLEAQSPRLTNVSGEMTGKSSSNYKVTRRFLKRV
jgi:hypothetical protein